MSILNSSIVPVGSTGYDIDNSLRFNDNDSAYLSRTPSTAGNRNKWTFSTWVKRGNQGEQDIFGAGTASAGFLKFRSDGVLQFGNYTGGYVFQLRSNALYRDPSAWYHIVAVFDTANATATQRQRLYVNGSEVSYGTQTNTTTVGDINNNVSHWLGHLSISGGIQYLDGYLAEVNFVDGQALTPADFGETDEDYGHWKPIEYAGSYGTNGFYLDFKNSGSLGTDASSNSNNWTPNNLAATDQMLDSPTNNFATWNALFEGGESSSSIYANTTLSEGNLQSSVPTNSYIGNTIRPQSGTWYSEFLVSTVTNEIGWGWINAPEYSFTTAHAGIANKWGGYYHGYAPADLRIYDETSQLGSNIALTISNGDILQLAWDIDNNKGWIGINNTWYAADNGTDGNPSAGTNQTFTFAGTEAANLQPYVANGTGTAVLVANFGQDSSFAGNKTAQGNADGNGYGDFYYAPPTGFLALCTQNLPEPTVVPSEHFNTVTWAAESPYSDISITGVGFQPDFVWAKHRTQGYSHTLFDAVRGVGKALITNATNAEETNSVYGYLGSFDSDGFTGTEGSIDNSYFNYDSTSAYVAWNWKANGTGVSNTNGSITSTVSANADAGFSISTYTGTGSAATIGHGLSKAPEMITVKNRENARNWRTYHKYSGASDPETDYLNLDETGAVADYISWNDTAPTSSVFSITSSSDRAVNYSGETFVAYCFHSVEGYSKVGSYTGNGSSDGTFVHCGFRPAYVMFKPSSAVSNWIVMDNARDTSNVASKWVYPDLSAAEESGAGREVDFTSNGFKLRNGGTGVNSSGVTYIYLAFAEVDFKHSNAR